MTWFPGPATRPAAGSRGGRSSVLGGPDDYVYVIVQPVGWRPLSELIGLAELPDDPEWATPRARLPKLNKMFQLIEEWSSTLPKWEVLERLNADNIPCGTAPVHQGDHRGPLPGRQRDRRHRPAPRAGRVRDRGQPAQALRLPRPGDQFAALLGEHNQEVYVGELGLGDEDLRLLKSNGVV
ncbi:formyl-CoA transferase [Streptomyces violaceorubidus]